MRNTLRTALVAYSVGLAGLILVKVLAPAFYARQDIRRRLDADDPPPEPKPPKTWHWDGNSPGASQDG